MKLNGSGAQIAGRLEDMPDDLLSDCLCKFILEVRNQKGEFYPRETVYSVAIMLQMFLSSKGRNVRLLQDSQFLKVRNTLDNHMKFLSKSGFITAKSKAEVITLSQENRMWESGILSDISPQKLLYTLMYQLGIMFALRASEEHKSLKFGQQLQLEVDPESSVECLVYTEQTAKNNQGGISALNQGGQKVEGLPK